MLKTNHRMIIPQSILAGMAIGFALIAAGCNDAGAPAPSAQYETPSREAPSSPMAAPHDETTVASFLGIRAPVPAMWTEHPPQSPMHHTTYNVPGAGGDDDGAAQIVVFFFGQGQGGPIAGNIQRWEAQFRSPDGSDVEADVRTFEADGLPVTLVELEGEYRGMGPVYAPNQRMLAAIIDAPGAQRIFIRFVGDDATVSAHRDAFITMIEEMQWVGE